MALSASFRGWLRTLRPQVWVRRVHLYAGLCMLPWLFFFGLSGLLFNHPGLGEDVRGQRIDPAVLSERGVLPWQPKTVANRVLAELNAQRAAQGQPSLALDAGYDTAWTGFTVLAAPFDQGRHTVLLDVQQARGLILTRKVADAGHDTSFPVTRVELPEHTTGAMATKLSDVLSAQELSATGPLSAHPKLAPSLRFTARDTAGQRWNLSYDARTGEVSGRVSDGFPNVGMSQLFALMHTTHHFPLRVGPLWFWALFEDLLGLSMMLWAITGMIMWWQVKRTRRLGALSLAVALALSGWVMSGTLDHVTFGDLQPQLGPGE